MMSLVRDSGSNDELSKMGNTYGPIHQAVFWENLEAVAVILSFGGDINLPTKRKCPTLDVAGGSTALHLAATIGNETLVRYLISNDADVSLKDDEGQTALDVATTLGCRAAIENA